jgi:hypothetical protein
MATNVTPIAARDGAPEITRTRSRSALRSPRLYVNRELAQLEFMSRVCTGGRRAGATSNACVSCITSMLLTSEVRVASLSSASNTGRRHLTPTA